MEKKFKKDVGMEEIREGLGIDRRARTTDMFRIFRPLSVSVKTEEEVKMAKEDLDRFRKMIVDGRHFTSVSAEDRKFIDSKKLDSDDMFRIFRILAVSVLGLRIVAWQFDCERDETTIWYE